MAFSRMLALWATGATGALFASLLMSDLSPAQARDKAESVPAPKIAVCAVPALVNELMQSDRFKPEREALEAQFRTEMQSIEQRLSTLRDRAQNNPDDPGMEGLAQEFGELRRKLAEKQREAAQALEKKTAEQLLQCYELARTSASAIAEQLGFNYVLASVGPDEELNDASVEVAVRQMMSRPAVMFPKEADITDDVRDDLNLQ